LSWWTLCFIIRIILFMDIKELFNPNACDPRGMASKNKWTRTEYFQYKKTLESEWIQVVLVDMIWHPVEWAVEISNELFFWNHYPDGTYFVLYCHSGWSSGYVQMQLTPMLLQYKFINMAWGIGMYELEKNNK